MSAATLKCPMCGASAAADSNQCGHCGSSLATVACPSCFGMMFLGAKFCSHCGAQARRVEVDPADPHPCPRCTIEMGAVLIGTNNLRECPYCQGIWADADSMQRIVADREQQAAVLGIPVTIQPPVAGAIEKVRYLRCPACSELMHRVNFAKCSAVIVDVCKAHGTWFDKDELRRIVEFIRAGGLDNARAREIQELERQRRALAAARSTPEPVHHHRSGVWGIDALGIAGEIAASLFDGW